MDLRSPGFVLLLWFPGVVLAQSATQSCQAPRLDGGYFPSNDETYSNNFELFYACNNGRKPVGEGWWATSKCINGTWVPKPQCIGEKSCLPPTIPNAKYTEASNGWYKEEHTIRITCDKGYIPKNNAITAKCVNATWVSVPVCEKNVRVCSAPSEIPHAVIINQEYKEVFDEDSEVQYECEDGYTVEGGSTKSIWCTAGNWTVGPSCNKTTEPDARRCGSTGSSTSSGSNKGECQITTISNCGRYPSVQNGDVVETHRKSLRYQCNSFYRLVGAEGVVCYSDGKWSEVPTCKAAFCALNTEAHPELAPDGVKHIKDGESMQVRCVDRWRFENHVVARCTDGELTMTRCKCHFKFITNVRMLLTETVGSLIFKFVSSNHCQFTNCVHANNLVIIVFGYQ
uniref:Complement factor H-like n=1 Tax=Mastacembelus armatus TaxID=205130 RepID=A0A3Q3L031_9TELE